MAIRMGEVRTLPESPQAQDVLSPYMRSIIARVLLFEGTQDPLTSKRSPRVPPETVIAGSSLPPLPTAYVTLVVAIVAGVFFVGRWMGDMGSFKTKAGETFNEIKSTLGAIEKLLANINDGLKDLTRALPSLTYDRGSSVRLTELGRTVSAAVDAPSMAEVAAADMPFDVVAMEAYDLQTLCFDHVHSPERFDEEDLARLKACAFENGIDLRQVLDVIAVELRDLLLSADQQQPGHGNTQ